jgi:predicted nucleotidyltransferase
MLQKYNRDKVLEVFFDNPLPEGGFSLREISRISTVPLPSVKNYLAELEKEKLVLKKQNRLKNPVYYANRDEEYFLFLKKMNNIKNIHESGVVEYIYYGCGPKAIILFGSTSRGEDILESDMDLFVISKDKELNLEKFEKNLNRKINVFFKEELNKTSKELANNVINGVILKGYVKVFFDERDDKSQSGRGKSQVNS